MGKSLAGKELGQGITQRKDGRYQARFTNRFGKRQVIYSNSLNEVRQMLRSEQVEDEKELNVISSELSLDEWFDIWLNTCKKNCRNTTKEAYTTHYNRIRSKLGWRKINKLNLIIIQQSINELSSDNERKNTKKILVDLLNKAVDSDLLIKNPTMRVNTVISKEQKKERRVLTIQETELLLEGAKTTFYYNLIVIALETGMRIGELCGLTWEDIDFEKRIVSVKHTLCYFSKKGKYVFEMHDTKTNNGKRNIPLTNKAIIALKQQRLIKHFIENSGKESLEGYSDLVFVTKNNHPTTEFLVKESLQGIVKKIRRIIPGFKAVSPHAFRHSFATRAIERGVSPKSLQKLLGHGTLQMTMDLYCHVTEDTLFDEMEKFEKNDSLVGVS